MVNSENGSLAVRLSLDIDVYLAVVLKLAAPVAPFFRLGDAFFKGDFYFVKGSQTCVHARGEASISPGTVRVIVTEKLPSQV